jgi:hypothetical protein
VRAPQSARHCPWPSSSPYQWAQDRQVRTAGTLADTGTARRLKRTKTILSERERIDGCSAMVVPHAGPGQARLGKLAWQSDAGERPADARQEI